MHNRSGRGFSLVEMLVVVVILAILAAFLLPRYMSSTKLPGGKTAGSPMQKAKGVECTTNLLQVRQAYTMATQMGDETRPGSLQDLRTYGVTDSLMKCPVGGTPYRFNPANGQVGCAYPGHERF